MLTRISLMFVVIAALCLTAFTLGGMTAEKQDTSGIPPGHPVVLALRYKQELGLTGDQIDALTKLHDDMAREFAPLKQQADSIQRRMEELQRSGKQDQGAAQQLQREGEAVGSKMQPIFEKYAKAAGDLLSGDQQEKLMKLSEASSKKPDEPAFALAVAMESREKLGITPQQFTKLQYLQADFIRAFAPLREQMELLQIEIQEKFGKDGKEPTPDYPQRGMAIQRKVVELQAQISERMLSEVLQPAQRTKLKELLHGEHGSGQNGG